MRNKKNITRPGKKNKELNGFPSLTNDEINGELYEDRKVENFEEFYVECLLPIPLPKDKNYTYKIDTSTKHFVQKKDLKNPQIKTNQWFVDFFNENYLLRRVFVDLNNRKIWALLIRQVAKPEFDCKSVLAIIDTAPIITTKYLQWLDELANFYGCSLGEMVAMALPASKHRSRKIFEQTNEKDVSIFNDQNLNHAQQQAVNEIDQSWHNSISGKKSKIHLLYGITGSGKTEVYIEMIRRVLSRGFSVFLLVPEIGLSNQMAARVLSAFRDSVAHYHSRLKPNERLFLWQEALAGRLKLVLGTRSALFLPLHNPGLVIMDEEHDSSYKEHSTPRYHSRQLAQLLFQKNGGLLLLGSATPSVESYYHARNQRIGFSQLLHRATNALLASVQIVDMNQAKMKGKYFSQDLYNAIQFRLKQKESIILFLNRRGYAPVVRCMSCNRVVSCPNCDIPLVYHAIRSKNQVVNEMRCHYCYYRREEMTECPTCGAKHLRLLGAAIQRIEEEIISLFPEAKIERMDLDSAADQDINLVLERFAERKIDILLGTQMIAKGLHFPWVTLVGVIQADTGLNLPDFRAAERTFSLLTQVAGRSGRGQHAGEVFIQTYQPEHAVMQYALAHDYDSFFKNEIKIRQSLAYPPFRRLLRIVFRSSVEERAQKDALHIGNLIRQIYQERNLLGHSVSILGPAPAPMPRIKNNWRFHLLIKEISLNRGRQIITQVLQQERRDPLVYREVDLDPLEMM